MIRSGVNGEITAIDVIASAATDILSVIADIRTEMTGLRESTERIALSLDSRQAGAGFTREELQLLHTVVKDTLARPLIRGANPHVTALETRLHEMLRPKGI